MPGGLDINKIHQGNCVELLKKLPDNSVDLVFADPPYNLQLYKELCRPDKSKVDSVVDDWDRFDSFRQYDLFTKRWLKECYRVLKHDGGIWVIGSYHNIFRVGAILQDLGFWILNDVVWIKTNPMPNFLGTRFSNAHETLIWAARSKRSKYTFHYHSLKTMNDDLQMRSDWLMPVCKGEERIRSDGHKAHPTQKPEELLYRIILSTSNPGDIILDPFSGSGTTAVVAKRLGRNFISFEMDSEYVQLAERRLNETEIMDSALHVSSQATRRIRVTLGNLVERGLIMPGEMLVSRDGKHQCRVLADASLEYEGVTGSLHKISSLISGSGKESGWLFWQVQRKGKMVAMASLRDEYIVQCYDKK